MKIFVLVFIVLLVGQVYGDANIYKWQVHGLESLNLSNGAGDVKISVATDDQVYVNSKKIDFGKNCESQIERRGKELIIKVSNKGWFNSDICKVEFDIRVPQAISLNLKMGSGNLDVSGIDGTVNFSLGSGNASINGKIAQLNGKSGSGSVIISGIIGEAEIKTGSGSVNIAGLTSSAVFKSGSGALNLAYATAPNNGQLDIKTGSGSATVFFPSAMKLLTSFSSGSGRVANDFGVQAEAPFKVSMKSGSGNLIIKKRP